jgi:hypothetical protein
LAPLLAALNNENNATIPGDKSVNIVQVERAQQDIPVAVIIPVFLPTLSEIQPNTSILKEILNRFIDYQM